jgi:translation initiation factor 2D
MTEIRDLLNSYITKHNLVNLRDAAYINLDDLLYSCVSAKKEGKGKNKDVEPESTVSKFMKRDELTRNVLERMQSWHEIRVEGKDPITKYVKNTNDFPSSPPPFWRILTKFRRKGSLSPIQIVTRLRNSRKATTRITGFEPFHAIDAEEMADDLRKVCAGATSGER